jgi:hypothetical protein
MPVPRYPSAWLTTAYCVNPARPVGPGPRAICTGSSTLGKPIESSQRLKPLAAVTSIRTKQPLDQGPGLPWIPSDHRPDGQTTAKGPQQRQPDPLTAGFHDVSTLALGQQVLQHSITGQSAAGIGQGHRGHSLVAPQGADACVLGQPTPSRT